MIDLTAKPIFEAIQTIESYGLTYEITRINTDSGQNNNIERVIRYYVSDNSVFLTTAYFENNVRDK